MLVVGDRAGSIRGCARFRARVENATAGASPGRPPKPLSEAVDATLLKVHGLF